MALNDKRLFEFVKLIEKNGSDKTLKKLNCENDKDLVYTCKKIESLLKDGYNPTLVTFIIIQDIDVKMFKRSEDALFKTGNTVNEVIKDNGVYSEPENAKISINDIVGVFSTNEKIKSNTNYLDIMNKLFDSEGSNYTKQYSSYLKFEDFEEALKKLSKEVIDVYEFDEDRYLVGSSGLQKFLLLKTLYLNDLDHNEVTPSDLRNKYKIPVKLRKINLDLTYAKFVLREGIDPNTDIEKITPNTFYVNYNQSNVLKYNKQQLNGAVYNVLENSDRKKLKHIIDAYDHHLSFARYVDDVVNSNTNNKGRKR